MKYKSLNNYVSRRLVRYVLDYKYHQFVTLLYNYRGFYEPFVLSRLVRFCMDILDSDCLRELMAYVTDNNDVQFVWFRQSFYNLYFYER